MKRFVYTLVLMIAVGFTSFAQNVETAEQRAKGISDRMIRELQLNNFQSRKIREINLDKAKKMMEFEAKFAGNQAELDKCFMGVCKERDKEVERVLSTAQYSQYYSARKAFNSFDREYAMKLQKENGKAAKALVAQDQADAKRTFPATQTAVIKETSKNEK
ncbi:hypothetical protein [Rufibacter sp. LB8]|uniref:hypothetical protein n=1 Tax=Rufibacter sp. LB8 TaxID=2777781 RepID=UPI00178C7B09|nr:hypothetical protein [Rufibacter sp. LB8]